MNTSKFLILGSMSLTALSAGTPYKGLTNDKSSRPNIIIILSDDQGYGDFSCHGNPILETPAMDRLHDESIRFEHFHVAPLCTPTRGQMLTGLDAFNNKAATVLTARNIMRRELITLPELLVQNGYETGIFGKWHLGDNYPDRPMDRGFQKCIWTKGWGLLSESEFDNDYYETRYLDSLEVRQSTEYCTNLWFNESLKWIDQIKEKDKPFFAYISLNVPHGPYHAPAQDFNYYKDKLEDQRAVSFFGMLRNVDRNLDRLENYLIEQNLRDNTILIYFTDNGGTGGVEVYNAGMRDMKGSNYEGGHRAAFFFRWPGGNLISPQTINYPAQIQDLFPTLIDMLALNGNPAYPFDGKSLRPLLAEGKRLDDRMFVVQYGGHEKPEKYFSCVVWNMWRLVGEDELYDLETDPGQEQNVAGENPGILSAMRSYYETWWSKVEPGINELIPLIVGSDKENPVMLTSHTWEFGAVNSQWNIAQGTGPVNGGKIHIQIVQAGRYIIELARWPFHLNRDITLAGPEIAVGGTQLRAGRAFRIEHACCSIDEKEPVVLARKPGDTTIGFEIDLPEGNHTIRGWFKDHAGNDILGAYYIRMKRLP